MRGKLGRYAESARDYGITPAYAGKTLIPSTKLFASINHPRVCGENPLFCGQYRLKSESPPRMRGKRSEIMVIEPCYRITPAYAGKTQNTNVRCALYVDHPRGCGENLFIVISADKSMGSPPRMRGKPCAAILRAVGRRITPADAGKTCLSDCMGLEKEDHPRGCGENMNTV